jgi:hypothetical protein
MVDPDGRERSNSFWAFVVGLAMLSVLLLMLTAVLLVSGPVSTPLVE